MTSMGPHSFFLARKIKKSGQNNFHKCIFFYHRRDRRSYRFGRTLMAFSDLFSQIPGVKFKKTFPLKSVRQQKHILKFSFRMIDENIENDATEPRFDDGRHTRL